MNDSPDSGLVISRVFNVAREQLWNAWTNPEIIKRWWGPKDFYAPSIKVDLHEGGKYIYAMHGPAGSEWDKDMYSSGIYKKIVPYEKLVVTDYFSDENGNKITPPEVQQPSEFPEELETTVLFDDLGNNKTKLSIVYENPHNEKTLQAMKDSGMEDGWNQSLDKLAEVLEP